MGERRALWAVELIVPFSALAAFEDALAPWAVASTSFEVAAGTDPLRPAPMWRLQILMDTPPDKAALARVIGETARALGLPPPDPDCFAVPEADWIAETNRLHAPVRAGRYLVVGSHNDNPPRAGAVLLRIDAGHAPGTGRHEPTRGCLLALDRLAKARRFRRPFDLGTGAGILAIAMAKTWRVPVLASDLDPISVAVARENTQANGVAGLVRCIEADGWRPRAVAAAGPFDLVTANLLAGPLRALARDCGRSMAPGGVAVLSGLLSRQQGGVLAAYRAQGFRLLWRTILGAWATLVLAKGRTSKRDGAARRPSPSS